MIKKNLGLSQPLVGVHLFVTCEFAHAFRSKMLDAFTYHMDFPNDPLILPEEKHNRCNFKAMNFSSFF